MIKRKLTYREVLGMLKEDKGVGKVVITNVPNVEDIDKLIHTYSAKIGDVYCVENEEGFNDDDYFIIIPEEFSDIRQNVEENLVKGDSVGNSIFTYENLGKPTDFHIALPHPSIGEKLVNVRILGYFGNKILDLVEGELERIIEKINLRDREISDGLTYAYYKSSAAGLTETVKEESEKEISTLVATPKDIDDVFSKGILEDPETVFEGTLAEGLFKSLSVWGIVEDNVPNKYLDMLKEAKEVPQDGEITEAGMYCFLTNEGRTLYYLVVDEEEKPEEPGPIDPPGEDEPEPPVDEKPWPCPGVLSEEFEMSVDGVSEEELSEEMREHIGEAVEIQSLEDIKEEGIYKYVKGSNVIYYVVEKVQSGDDPTTDVINCDGEWPADCSFISQNVDKTDMPWVVTPYTVEDVERIFAGNDIVLGIVGEDKAKVITNLSELDSTVESLPEDGEYYGESEDGEIFVVYTFEKNGFKGYYVLMA